MNAVEQLIVNKELLVPTQDTPLYHCNSCGVDKPQSDFDKAADRKNGIRSCCKVCRSRITRERLAAGIVPKHINFNNKITTVAGVDYCLCNKCGLEKQTVEFYKNKESSNGLANKCIACRKKDSNDPRERDRIHNKYITGRLADVRHSMLVSAKRRARVNGLPFSLVVSDIFIPKTCPVLGIPLQIHQGKAQDDSPSLDRINSKLGYVAGNVWVVSNRINRIKSDATVEELKLVAAYMRSFENVKLDTAIKSW